MPCVRFVASSGTSYTELRGSMGIKATLLRTLPFCLVLTKEVSKRPSRLPFCVGSKSAEKQSVSFRRVGDDCAKRAACRRALKRFVRRLDRSIARNGEKAITMKQFQEAHAATPMREEEV